MNIEATKDRKTARIKKIVFAAVSFQDEQFLSGLFNAIQTNEKLLIVGEDGEEHWIRGCN